MQVLNQQMPCPFTGPKMFCAGPNFLSQPKKLTAFSATSKPFVPAQKPIWLNANKFLVWHKKYGPGQNSLGPVKGQGNSLIEKTTESNSCQTSEVWVYFSNQSISRRYLHQII